MQNPETEAGMIDGQFPEPDSILLVKKSNDNSIHSKIEGLLEELDIDILIKLSSLPRKKKEELKNDAILYAHTQIYCIAELRYQDDSIIGEYENRRKSINLLASPILLKLLEVYLKYRLAMMQEPEEEKLVTQFQNITEKSLFYLTEKSKDPDCKELMDALCKIESSKFFKIIESVQKGASADLYEFVKSCKRPVNIPERTFVKIIMSLLTPVSKVMLMLRIRAELLCLNENRPKMEEHTRLMAPPSTKEMIDEIKNHWDSGISQYIFMFKTSANSEEDKQNYIESIIALSEGTISGNTKFISLSPNRFLLTISNEIDIANIKDFVSAISDEQLNENISSSVSFSLLNPSIFDKKLEEYIGDFDNFINEIVINTIYRHLGQGIQKAEEKDGSGFQIACGNIIINEMDFYSDNMENLSHTQLSFIPDLGAVTEIDGEKTEKDIRAIEKLKEMDSEAQIPETRPGKTPSKKNGQTHVANVGYPFGETRIIDFSRMGTGKKQSKDKEKDTSPIPQEILEEQISLSNTIPEEEEVYLIENPEDEILISEDDEIQIDYYDEQEDLRHQV